MNEDIVLKVHTLTLKRPSALSNTLLDLDGDVAEDSSITDSIVVGDMICFSNYSGHKSIVEERRKSVLIVRELWDGSIKELVIERLFRRLNALISNQFKDIDSIDIAINMRPGVAESSHRSCNVNTLGDGYRVYFQELVKKFSKKA